MKEKAIEEILELLKKGKINSREELQEIKIAVSRKYKLGYIIKNSEILKAVSEKEKKKFLKLLQRKPTRTISGVAVVAVMTHPERCPHGKCNYCPGGVEIGVPQSYTGKEPATRRALQYGFDPYLQTTFRLYQLKSIGHPIDKVELIVMGGTLTSRLVDYQEWFVKMCLKAMNDFQENFQRIEEKGEEGFIEDYIKSKKSKTFDYLENIQKKNEKSKVRCVGITFEPRPDWAKKEQINYMLSFGVTRVEIGVQCPFDFVYKKVNRGHTVKDVIEATSLLKDSALKVSYHLMPGILGFNPEFDLRAFKRIIEDPNFRPDMIKIYPCVVLKGTKLYEDWKKGEFRPLETKEAIELISKMKAMLPPWIRTMRVMRDIPSNLIVAGVKASNLHELVIKEMEKKKLKCRCIRCREVGRFLRKGIVPKEENIKLVRREYEASKGKEIFLSFEDVKKDILIGFLRLRIPYKPFRKEIDSRTSLIRELHVYGPMVEIGEKPEYEYQHRGYGKELLREAERISEEEFDMKKIIVISGIGVREYYRNLGYRKQGVYMMKKL